MDKNPKLELETIIRNVSAENKCLLFGCADKFAEAIYEAGYSKQEWISVDERLPDVLQEVLVYRGNHIGNLMNAYTYVGGDMWQDEYGFGCRREDEGITHWMPLPEPPKGGAE